MKALPRKGSFIIPAVFILFFNFSVHAQEKKEVRDSLYSVIYFGATSCYYCNTPENIANISKMVNEIKTQYKGLNIKTLIVSMDEEIPMGLKFIQKYDTTWDEIAIGSFYKNELAIIYLNKTKIPGVPHIVVIKHFTKKGEYNIQQIVKDEILVDLVGGTQIDKWLKDGYLFKK